MLLLCGLIYLFAPHRYNPDKAVAHLTENALSRSHTCCAWFVMRAMQAGGCPMILAPAHSYSTILPYYGFKEVKTTTYKKGDIVVFPAVKGHKWGHIAMWNGEQWVSDFKQKGIIVSSAYKNADYKVWRYK